MPVSSSQISALKQLLLPIREALYHGNLKQTRQQLRQLVTADALVQLSHPFNILDNVEHFLDQALLPLHKALPDLERRETIVMAGETVAGDQWLACCGYYTGTFTHAFLDIPATGHQVSLRFHEFFRVVDNRVCEIQALWDLPELMMQARAWPMACTLGREWHVPGPATQDGVRINSSAHVRSEQSEQLVISMLNALGEYSEGGVAAMQLERYWHPHFSWYGPSGIGTARGVDGFRNWHQIPFLNAMPDRVAMVDKGHLIAEGDYVAFTAWPGMQATISGDGWLGIAPANQSITMRSLDFWRCENSLIRENWVLVDLLHVFDQVGVDVLQRMREMTKARSH